MVVLHFAIINNNPFNGVCVAVPQHVIFQKKYATTGLININNKHIKAFENYPGTQIEYKKLFDIKKLPEPFDHPDLVVFHECYRAEYIAIAINLLHRKIPYVIIPHGELRIEAQKKKRIKKYFANLLLFNLFIRKATAIQCLSKEEEEATFFGRAKILGTNGICIPEKSKDAFHTDKIVFIYIGRYEWRVKGLDILFQAIRIEAQVLRENHAVFELFGPDIQGRLAEVKHLVEQNQVEDLVKLNLAISGTTKEQKLLDSDVFIQTSRHEGMPMGVLEAMSYAIPCLLTDGTNVGRYIETIGAGWNGGMNASTLARAIKTAIEERALWKEKGKTAREYVKNEFDWDSVSMNTVEKYKEICMLGKK